MKIGDKVRLIPKFITAENAKLAGFDIKDIKSLPKELLITELKPNAFWKAHNNKGSLMFDGQQFYWPMWWFEVIEERIEENKGIKDFQNKVSYQEIDWNFITAMAKRLNSNKVQFGGKYENNNWKLDIDLKEIQDALIRHFIALVQPNPEDSESSLDHLAAIGINCQILYFHLKKNNERI